MTSTGAAGSRFTQKKGTGYISSIFHEEDLVKLKGNLGIGEFMAAFYYLIIDFGFLQESIFQLRKSPKIKLDVDSLAVTKW